VDVEYKLGCRPLVAMDEALFIGDAEARFVIVLAQ
jgi:hypothetical protein